MSNKHRFAKSTKTGLLLGDSGLTERYLSRAKKLPASTTESDLSLVWGAGVRIIEADDYQLARDIILCAQYDLSCKHPVKHFPHYAATNPVTLYRKLSVPAKSGSPATVRIDGTVFAVLWKDGAFHTDHLI